VIRITRCRLELHEDQRPRRVRGTRACSTPSIAACRMRTVNSCSVLGRLCHRPRSTTGKELWVVKHAHPDKGETITPAPIIATTRSSSDSAAMNLQLAAGHRLQPRRRQKSVGVSFHRTDKDVCLTPTPNKKHPEYGTAGKDLGVSTYVAMSGNEAAEPRGLVCLRSGAAPGLLRHRQSRSVVAAVPLLRTADSGELQQRQVRQ